MSNAGYNISRDAIWIAVSELLVEQGVFTKNDLETRLDAHESDGKIDTTPSEHTLYDVLNSFEEIGFVEKRSSKSSVNRPGPIARETLDLSPRAKLLSQSSYQPLLVEKTDEELGDFLLDQSDEALESLFNDNISPSVIRDLADNLS